jgi:hypothetical protein
VADLVGFFGGVVLGSFLTLLASARAVLDGQ